MAKRHLWQECNFLDTTLFMETNPTTFDLTTAAEPGVAAGPLHERVKERILRRIVLGDWPEGKVLPSEAELARLFGVSYGTIRRAMQDLVAQGVVTRRRRTGTVVTGRTPHHTLSRYYHYYRLHRADGALTTTTAHVVSSIRRQASTAEARELRLDENAVVCAIVRLREAEGQALMIDRVVIPLAIAPDLPIEPDKLPALLYQWLLKTQRVRLSAVREHVSARLATPEDCTLLGLDPGKAHALLDIEETAFDQHDRPICLMHHAAVTGAHRYVNEIR